MFKNRDKIIARVAGMPRGEFSPTNRYWCVTCKMLFDIEKPVCPYMSRVCINTPIPVELEPPETTASLEKFGLFYPKIPQQVMAHMARQAGPNIGESWAKIYLDFLKDWRFPYASEPLQTLKSFIVVIAGCETGQRVREGKITFILTDRHKVWDGEYVYEILEAGIEMLRGELGINQEIDFDELAIVGDAPTGKYFCAMCRKFFEFSIQRKTITCPIMPQKCMAKPMPLEKSKYSLMDLMTVYEYTPDLYRRFIEALPNRKQGISRLKEILKEDWLFDLEEEPLQEIQRQLGLI